MILEYIGYVLVLDFGEDKTESFMTVDERWIENRFDLLELFQ